MTNLDKLLWEEMTTNQQKQYEDEWVTSYMLETAGDEETARLIFDCKFDCCVHNERVYSRREFVKEKSNG